MKQEFKSPNFTRAYSNSISLIINIIISLISNVIIVSLISNIIISFMK